MAEAVRVVCLLVHGRGQTQEDMAQSVISRVDAKGVRWVMPAAPGKSWYKARAVDPLTPETEVSLGAGFARFDALLAEARAAHPGVPVVAVGFSQGACMVAEWVLHGAGVQGLVVLTGCRVGALGVAATAVNLNGLPVYAACGDQDSWIPVAEFLGMVGVLAGAGARVRADLFPGRPHEVSAPEIVVLSRFLDAVGAGRDVFAGEAA